MNRTMKLLVGVALIFGLHFGLGRLTQWRVSCGEPCPGLGADCEPLRSHLEMKAGSARAGEPALIWYRAALKNSACETLVPNIGDFFLAGKDLQVFQRTRQTSYFRVFDRDGKEIVPVEATLSGGDLTLKDPAATASVLFVRLRESERMPWEDPRTVTENIEPYITDLSAQDDPASDEVRLGPGQEITACPTKYWPHRREYRALDDGARALTASVTVPVPDKGRPLAPHPPPGFRLMDFFLFRKPGTYRIQLVLEGTVYGRPHYMKDSLPKLVKVPLEVLNAILLNPSPSEITRRDVTVLSNLAEVEVAR